MKAIPVVLFLSTMISFVSCKKDFHLSPGTEDTFLMTVKEYKTNIPLTGVNITLYKCSKYDDIFGCQAKSVFATRTTNENGEYAFTLSELNQANEGIILSKYQYWSAGGGQGDIFMEPQAFVNLTLMRDKMYPDTSIFELKTAGEFGNVSFERFMAPKDSMFSYTLFGNEKNVVNWMVFTKDLSCLQYCPEDTLAKGSFTLDLRKFEATSATIYY